MGNLRFPWKVAQRLSTELSVPVTRGILPPVALAATHILFFAPPGVETYNVLENVFLSWAVEWVRHTIAQAGAFIAPTTVMRPGEARVHPCALLPLQPQQVKHG